MSEPEDVVCEDGVWTISTEEATEEDIERFKPWAMPLRMLRFRVADKTQTNVSFGQMLKDACKYYKVDYPPEDIAGTMLMLAFRWSMLDLPIPEDEAC